ncbi:AAA family ATPase [Alkalihalophilus marmarensis]|uniref:AAA family ATPase n=1 Tax=Alkalihalophilus marmarensis TaxID=521377 RepID=UPI002DBF08A4|nr:AAA family ATPase [Alkalihalophilus marmarensis]MEC2074245.1 AAA family ATPase [Alkalihalophilus marmarensis]
MRNILIFKGPNSRFEEIIKAHNENVLSLYEILESRKKDEDGSTKVGLKDYYESIIIDSTDFSSLSETGERLINHMLTTFVYHFDIKHIFIQNPTETIEKKIKIMAKNNSEYNLEIIQHTYPMITKESLLNIYQNYSGTVIGQEKVKEEMLNVLYTIYKKRNKGEPLVLMFFGPSGVGKTESAKYFSEVLGGNKIFRVQMSMFQNSKSLDYLFGEEHNAKSFALDLLERESNVILLDEFDKTFDTVYSAFYQMFDEGVFRDRNYNVNLEDAIIICTSNYSDLTTIRRTIGDPLYFRFNKHIEFDELKKESVIKIIKLIYDNILEELDDSEKDIVVKARLIDYILSNVDTFMKQSPNYRRIKNFVGDLINSLLVKELIDDIEQ